MASTSCSSSKRAAAPPPCLLDYLYDNLLLQVLERIPDVLDRRSFRLVCKSFLESECVSRKRVTLLRAELLERVLRRFEKLEELDLSFCVGISDDHLAMVGDVLNSGLMVVNLSRVGSFTNAGLVHLASKCSSLAVLDLSYCTNVGNSGLAALGLPNKLENLSFTGCFRVSDAGLESIASGCLRLKALVLKGCVAITDAGLRFVTERCKEITYLDLSFTEITDDGVAHVTGLPCLISLKLTACNNVGDDSLEHLRTGCKTLEELDVARCQVTLARIRTLSSLTYLNISQCMQISEEALMQFQWPITMQTLKLEGMEITGDGLQQVATGCKHLKELSISKSRGVTDSRITSIITECKEITKLNFTCCFELTETTLFSIAINCSSLKSLRMESSSMVTDSSLRLVLRKCNLLEELDVTDCNITDAGLTTVGNCRFLRVLKLAFCQTTNAGISLLGASCSNLSELDLYRCRYVGDDGVSSIVRGCENLQVLNLSYCVRITDASMGWIARLSKLYQLEIRGCNLITSNGLRIVAAGCKRLVELDIKRCTRIEDSGVLALEHLCPDLRQINVSYCPLSNNGLKGLGRLGCLQNMKLVHLRNVSMECFGDVLLSCMSLKKVKLLSHIKDCLPSGVVEQLENRGCRLRWMDKPDFF